MLKRLESNRNVLGLLAATIMLHLCCSSVFAQILNFPFERITSEDGLIEDDYNWYLRKDSRDFIWISSIDGLFRYDGLNIELITGKEDAFRGKNIQSNFFEDLHSNLWFTSYEAIHCYQRSKDDFTSFQVGKQNQLESTNYHAFHLDLRSHQLWLKAGEHLYCFHTQNAQYQMLGDTTNAYRFVVDTFPNGKVKEIYAFYWEKAGMDIFTSRDTLWQVERKWQNVPPYGLTYPLKIYSGLIENDEELWLFSNQGLLLYHRHLDTLIQSFKPLKYQDILFKSGLFLNDQYLLLATKKRGLYLFDRCERTFIKNWDYEEGNPYSLPASEIHGLYLDEQQRLWLSYPDLGIEHSIVSPSTRQFQNPLHAVEEKLPRITFLLEDSSDLIWAGTKHRGLHIFSKDGQSEGFFSYKSGKENNPNIEELRHLSIDNKGRIWCVGKVAIYLYEDQKWRRVFYSEEHKLRHLFHLPDGKIIVLTSMGLFDFFIEIDKGRLEPRAETIFKNQTAYSFLQIFQISQDELLFPFQDTELLRCRYKQGKINCLDRFLTEAEVHSIYKDTIRGFFWLGTSNGLLRLDSTFNQLPSVVEDPKIRYSNIFGVLGDDHGNIWYTSSTGIHVYYPSNKSTLHFGIKDGLSGIDFSKYAALKASDGKMWLGHNKGLTVFHPDSVKPYNYIPKPYITDLLVNGTPFSSDTTIGEINNIKLSHLENSLVFDIKAIGYHHASLNTIKYKLHGLMDNWRPVFNGQSIPFRKLSPSENEYILEYRAVNANGLESESKKLKINIEPPLYKKRWFQILILLLILALVYAYYRYRIGQIQKEAKYQQLIAETETAVLRLQMNPHFIFNGMNSISSYILQDEHSRALDCLELFARLMRMILDLAAKPLIEVTDEIELLTLYLEMQAIRFEQRFDYSISCSEDFDADEYLIPPMIIQPFVENAILHGLAGKKEKGRIDIRFWKDQHSLFCTVNDNGIGREAAAKLKTQVKKHESKALAITQRRLELLEKKNGVDSSIEFIDLFDEHCQASGTQVCLRLPLL